MRRELQQHPETYETHHSQLSLITGVNNRIKFLGWYKKNVISKVCAERRYELSEYSNRQKRPKGTRKRESNFFGIWTCLKCRVVFEIAKQSGTHRQRPEVHFYKDICRLGKAKKECPKCTGELSEFKVMGLH